MLIFTSFFLSWKFPFLFQVTAIIEGQLVALDGQMTYAPADVTKKARMKMLDRTLLWVAARNEKEIPLGLADCYAKSLVQLLTEPESMKTPERQRPSDPRSGLWVLVLVLHLLILS